MTSTATVWLAASAAALAATVVGSVWVVAQADGQTLDRPFCAPLRVVDDGLHEAGERPTWRGTTMDGSALVVYQRPDGLTWSLVSIAEGIGVACVIRIGTRGGAITAQTLPALGDRS